MRQDQPTVMMELLIAELIEIRAATGPTAVLKAAVLDVSSWRFKETTPCAVHQTNRPPSQWSTLGLVKSRRPE